MYFVENSSVLPSNSCRAIPHNLLFNFSEIPLFPSEWNDNIELQLPYPIHKPFPVKEIDFIASKLKAKHVNDEIKEEVLRNYKHVQNSVTHNFKKSKTVSATVSKGMLKRYREYFEFENYNSDYDAFYSNFLETVNFNNKTYLVRPTAENKLCLNNINKPRSLLKVFQSESPMLSLKSYKINGSAFLIIREKCTSNVLKFNEDNAELIWARKQKQVIFDSKINRFNRDEIALLSTDYKLKLFDLENNKAIKIDGKLFKNKKDFPQNQFLRFDFVNRNQVLVLTEKAFKLFDYRSHNSENENVEVELRNKNCNSLCNFLILPNKNDLLVFSRHYVLKYDFRNLTEPPEFYTHTLKQSPSYFDYLDKNGCNYLLLGNQMGEKVIFTNQTSYSMPFKVSSLSDTYDKCILQNDLLLNETVRERLQLSTGGLKLVDNGCIKLYSCNNLGEIFEQKINTQKMKIQDKNLESISNFQKWADSLPQKEPELNVTHIEEMSRARYALNNLPIRSNLERYTKNECDFLKRFNPIYSRFNEELSEVAKNFLSVWHEDDSSDEEQKSTIAGADMKEVPAIQKVNFWMQANDFQEQDDS